MDTTTNYTIVVNFPEDGSFGCSKKCTYCTWSKNPFLPKGLQSDEKIISFINKCKKNFITVSGGGDPLFKFEENKEKIFHLVNLIKSQGYKTRLITREIEYIKEIAHLFDFISVSLDTQVFSKINILNDIKTNIEYSIVLPPIPTENIIESISYYNKLQKQLGRRLVLRENINSIFPLELNKIKLDNSKISIVPAKLCLSSKYLASEELIGYDIIKERFKIINEFSNISDLNIFGSFLKHKTAPSIFMDYNDIDVTITEDSTLQTLKNIGFQIIETTDKNHSYPKYFSGYYPNCDLKLHIVKFNNKKDSEEFLFSNQLDIDRVYTNRNKIYSAVLSEDDYKLSLLNRTANYLGNSNSKLLHPQRQRIEQQYENKLKSKYKFKWKINEMD